MKKRMGFVSNSSSSSFIIWKKDITPKQLDKIKNHVEIAKTAMKCMDFHYSPEWIITEDDYVIMGSTSMNNFEMNKFLDLIGVDSDKVSFRS